MMPLTVVALALILWLSKTLWHYMIIIIISSSTRIRCIHIWAVLHCHWLLIQNLMAVSIYGYIYKVDCYWARNHALQLCLINNLCLSADLLYKYACNILVIMNDLSLLWTYMHVCQALFLCKPCISHNYNRNYHKSMAFLRGLFWWIHIVAI